MEYSQERAERDHDHCQIEHAGHRPNLQRSNSGFALHSPGLLASWRGQAIGCDRRPEGARAYTGGRQSMAASSRRSGMFAAHCWNGGKFRCFRFSQPCQRRMNRAARRLSRGLLVGGGLID